MMLVVAALSWNRIVRISEEGEKPVPSVSISYGPHFGAGWEVVGHLPGWRPGEQRKEAGLEGERRVGGWARVEEKLQVWLR